MRARVERAVLGVMRNYVGPGGACAVLHEGQVVAAHTWGFANAERGIAFTPRSLFRMCSITKQFTVAAVLQAGGLEVLDAVIAARLRGLVRAPRAADLAHNQSGLRDYWAVAMLQGALAESGFGEREARRVIDGARSLQFEPGAHYSYCNQNFRLLSDALEECSGRDFGWHLQRIFDQAGMARGFLAAETAAMPDGTVGYEGSQAAGFRPAVNNILWTGDAGLGACLEDMIAWERWIDATRDDAEGLYRRLCAPVIFQNGLAAQYGFGLARRHEFGHDITGHGGALRGWRSHRLHVADARISVVVMFNHLSDAQAAAMELLAAALDVARPVPDLVRAPGWVGAYLEPQTGLSARIEAAGEGQVRLRFGHSAELLGLQADGSAGAGQGTRLCLVEGRLRMVRPAENFEAWLEKLAPEEGTGAEAAGRYVCAELGAELTLFDAGGVLYGAFGGFLGQGRAERLDNVGRDVWALPCPRALDHTPPGDWSLRLLRDAAGRVEAVMVGCWLARGLVYARVGS